MKNPKRNSLGFTIVEMAIVVFVIGLIIAGITAGKSVLAGAKVRSIIGELEENAESMHLFHEKYFEWPGDMSDAEEIFGASTKNGDGDERIEWNSGEGTLAWYHLTMAKMTGQTNFVNTMTTNGIIGQSVPSSRTAGAGWFINYNEDMQNHLGLGSQQASGVNDGGVLDPQRAEQVDIKMDDGAPATGKARSDDANGCIVGDAYAVNESRPVCMMRFSMQ